MTAAKAEASGLAALQAEVGRLEDGLGRAASADDHASARDELRALSSRAAAAEAALEALRQSLARETEGLRAEHRAGDEGVRSAVDAGVARLQAAIAALGEEVDCREERGAESLGALGPHHRLPVPFLQARTHRASRALTRTCAATRRASRSSAARCGGAPYRLCRCGPPTHALRAAPAAAAAGGRRAALHRLVRDQGRCV